MEMEGEGWRSGGWPFFPPSVTAPDVALIEMLRNGNHGSTREVALIARIASKHILQPSFQLQALYQTDKSNQSYRLSCRLLTAFKCQCTHRVKEPRCRLREHDSFTILILSRSAKRLKRLKGCHQIIRENRGRLHFEHD